jgi:PAS domain S-box-containing protein
MQAEPNSRDELVAEVVRLRTALAEAQAEGQQARQAERAARAALQASQQRFHDITEAAGEFIWEVDTHGLYTYASPGCRKLLGYTEQEIVGRLHFYDLHPESDRERFRREALEVFARRGLFKDLYNQARAKDGRLLDLVTNGIPIVDADGRLCGYRGSDRDITERRHAEQALAEEAARRRILFEQSRDGIVVLDINGKVYEANRHYADMLGYAPDEMLGLHVWDWDLQWGRAELLEMIRLLDARGDHFATYHLRKDGTSFPVEISTSATVWADKKFVLCICRDITERQQAEEARHQLELQLLHAQKLESLGVLAGGIAHDFNNILAGIRGYADLVLTDLPHSSPNYERVEEIRIATRRAADLTRQILTYAGKGQFRPEPVDLSQVVAEMRGMLEVGVSRKASFTYDLARDLPAVQADVSQIRQVLMNLVANAAEALGDRSGTVAIATRVVQLDAELQIDSGAGLTLAPGTYACLEVADTGCGMDPDTQHKIFDPFFTTKFAGRGLGLATVQGIVRSHGGVALVRSQPGEGSNFRVLLPVAGGRAVRVQPSAVRLDPHAGTGTVLVVDDEDSVRKSTQAMFAFAGFEVLTASDGQQAIEVFRQHRERIVCVVLDLAMPKMSGEEVLAELQRLAPEVRVILTSGYAEEEMIKRFAGQRVFGFVQKPDPIDAMIVKLQQSLADERHRDVD